MKRHSSSRSFRSTGLARALPFPFSGGNFSSFLFIALAAFFLLVSALHPQSVSGLRTSAADTLAPVLSAIGRPIEKVTVFVQDISGLAELQAENIRLEKENARLREWYQTALLLEAENKSLRVLLNVKLDPQHSYIAAQILSDSGNTFVKSLLVKAGREDGVQKGQAVISGDGVIGRIVEVGEHVSRILLITDMNSRVPILVENTSQHAILAGDNGKYARLLHVSADSEIAEGARIITSGHGGLFPKGLPIGRVVKGDDGDVFVQPYADFERMVYVRIVSKKDDPNLRTGILN